MNNVVVAKFGGSSLSDADQFRKVKSIILSDNKRKYIIPSAPGKRFRHMKINNRSKIAMYIFH